MDESMVVGWWLLLWTLVRLYLNFTVFPFQLPNLQEFSPGLSEARHISALSTSSVDGNGADG